MISANELRVTSPKVETALIWVEQQLRDAALANKTQVEVRLVKDVANQVIKVLVGHDYKVQPYYDNDQLHITLQVSW